jgi:hypothetical protein
MTGKSAADIDLGTTDHNAFFVLVHHFQGQIRIGPVQSLLAPASPWFRERAGNGEVFFLDHFKIVHEPGVVGSSQIPVHFPGGAG